MGRQRDGDFSDAVGIAPTLTWVELESLGIDDGPADYTVALRVSLGSGATTSTATGAAALTVTNTAPTAVVATGQSATAGEPFTVQIGANDPSSADTAAGFQYTINWGDRSPIEVAGGPAVTHSTHIYSSSGTVSATVFATDKDGGVGEPVTQDVQVAPTPSPSPSPSTSPSPTPPPAVSTPGRGALPSTGADVGAPVLITVGVLLALGTGLLFIARRRRRSSDEANDSD